MIAKAPSPTTMTTSETYTPTGMFDPTSAIELRSDVGHREEQPPGKRTVRITVDELGCHPGRAQGVGPRHQDLDCGKDRDVDAVFLHRGFGDENSRHRPQNPEHDPNPLDDPTARQLVCRRNNHASASRNNLCRSGR